MGSKGHHLSVCSHELRGLAVVALYQTDRVVMRSVMGPSHCCPARSSRRLARSGSVQRRASRCYTPGVMMSVPFRSEYRHRHHNLGGTLQGRGDLILMLCGMESSHSDPGMRLSPRGGLRGVRCRGI